AALYVLLSLSRVCIFSIPRPLVSPLFPYTTLFRSPAVPGAPWGSAAGWPARRCAPAFDRWLSPAQMGSETPASFATRPRGPHEPAARRPRAAEGSGACHRPVAVSIPLAPSSPVSPRGEKDSATGAVRGGRDR